MPCVFQLVSRTFPSCNKNFITIEQTLPLSTSSQFLEPPFYSLLLWIFLQIHQVNGIVQYLSSFDLLISLLPISSSFIHGAANDKMSFILKCWNTLQCMYTPHFLFDLSARGHWAVFLDFVYNTAMDTWLYISPGYSHFIFFGHKLKRVIPGSYDRSLNIIFFL